MRNTWANVALAVMMFACVAKGQTLDEGITAFEAKDYSKALKVFEPLAESGDSLAQSYLGIMYIAGFGVPCEPVEGVKWFQKAAEQGHADAQTLLGVMYAKGTGVPKDDVMAYAWFNLSAAQGKENARRSREVAAQDMSPEQVAEAQRLSREWLKAFESKKAANESKLD